MAPSLLSALLLWNSVALQPHATQPALPLLHTIVQIVSEPSVFELRPENVAERFAALTPLKPTVRTNLLRRYVGHNQRNGISWVMVDFQPSGRDGQQWTLLQVQICVESSGSANTALRSNLVRKLGQPTNDGDRASWEMGEHREVSLQNGRFEAPEGGSQVSGVLITAAVLQGEPE